MRVTPLLALTLVACTEPPIAHGPAPGEKASRADAVRTGQVVDAISRAPIAGAEVQVAGTLRRATTDEDGRFEILVPGGFGRLEAASPGYLAGSATTDTLALWPAETTEADAHAVLDQRELGRMARDADDLDDPDLTPLARELIEARRRAPGLTDAQLLPRRPVLKGALELPATVRVYRRGAENDSCRGRVDVIPLEEYVRGVVPHEWIPSWHLESLKAGAVAARTYAANWVLNGGKYDCADVDDTARSQVYADDRNARADDAVRATACEVVVRDGAMINAEYSAENSDPTEFGVSEPLCSGRARNGHGRGMCQWGTQRWADQRGQTYRWMVEHYYPGGGVGNGCADPRPDVQLRQRLARVDAERTQALEEARSASAQLERNVRERTAELDRLNSVLRKEIEQRCQLEAVLAEAAATDALTRLLNRRGMVELLEQLAARTHQQRRHFCVAIADVDHFKSINDRFGHASGDRVLVAVASRLRRDLKGEEAAARWGGEEFLMVWPEIPLAAAEERANRLREALAAMPLFDGAPTVTISFGLVEYSGLEPLDACLVRADKALYRAKELGRDRVVVS
ncbi:MAG: diguanylate cyclase [Xanthomonadales bacterium]|nr:diguanylate cyclase [Xanthomonadales bacterium]